MNKNNILTVIFIIISLVLFTIFSISRKSYYEVIKVISPVKFVVDFNSNKIADSDEYVCLSEINTFDFDDKNNIFNISIPDYTGISYLAREFASTKLLNKDVKIKFSKNQSSECRYADIKLNNVNYIDILLNSGYGIKDGKVFNRDKYEKNLENAKKLNLVLLNHHSNKYHKLDCEYGNLASDTILIPLKQLPKDAKPCKFCHQINEKLKRKVKSVKNIVSTPQLVNSSGDMMLYFMDFTKQLKPNSNCSSSVCRAFIKLVENAHSSVDIAIYGYENVPSVTLALENARKRGVKIRFVYDETSDPKGNFYHSNNLISAISNKYKSDKYSTDSSKIMHNKFVIFDDKKVFTGSMNFSKTGFSGYDANDILIINSPEVAKLYKAEFEQMLGGKFHKSKSKHECSNKFIVDNSELEVYFSPQDKSSARVIELINSAKKYIYIPVFLITHTDISNALVTAHKRGIDVKIILDGNSSNTRNSKHVLLRNSGIPLKFENYAGKLHSKTMIIDDEYVIMGSMNFSNSGVNKNDENMLVIYNSEFAKSYVQFFKYLWELIPDKYLKSYIRAESLDSIGSCSDGVDNNFDGKIDSEDDGCK